MKKGIYQDSKGFYIHTKRKGHNITIRGYKTRQEAENDFDYAIDKWLKEHELSLLYNSYSSVVNEYLIYRAKVVRGESLRKDKTQLKYFDTIFSRDTIANVYESTRIKVIYQNILDNNSFSPNKKNQLINSFIAFTKFCYMSNYIGKGAFDIVLMTFLPIKDIEQPTKEKRYISISYFYALSSEICKANDYLFNLAIFVLYFGGLRISELLGLFGSDIDLEKKTIKVQRQLLTNGSLTTTLKTKNSYRVVPMNKELFDLFKKFELMNRVFDYSHTTFKRKLSYYEQLANIPNYSCHEFRHSFCTNLASKISNISEVSYCAKVSGHTSSMFLNTYVKSLDSELVNKFF